MDNIRLLRQMLNAMRFDSPESLIDLLHSSNLKEIQESMLKEITRRCAKDLGEWRGFLTNGEILDE